MSDDAEAVVIEVSKAVGTALDELHFAMEALGDAVVFSEAPHTGDLGSPGGKGLGQGHQWREAGGLEIIDGLEEL